MDNTTIYVSSVTHAMRGRALLAKHGIAAEVERQTDETGRAGCGYYLRIRGDRQRAEQLLRQAGIRVLPGAGAS